MSSRAFGGCDTHRQDSQMKAHYGPAGVHWFDRTSGLNILLDEKPVHESQWSIAPKYVSFALTNACDLECFFCYAPKHGAKLSRSALLAWLRELDDAGCLGVGFGGGEPTLLAGFADLCREVHDTTSLAVTFTTHAHRLTPTMAQELRGHVDFIRVSMDGLDGTYERHRGRSFNSFDQQLDIVRSIAGFGINYVLNDATVPELSRAAQYVFGKGASELLLLPELANGQPVSPKALSGAAAWIRENYQRYRLATSAQGAQVMAVPFLPVNDTTESGRDFMHVDASGFLKLSAFSTGGVAVGQYRSFLAAVREARMETH
jgi:hypothetical protein